MTEIHADTDALKGLREALVRYRHAQRDVAARGDDVIKMARAALEERARRCHAQLELSQAELSACRERAAEAAQYGPGDDDGDGTVDCSGYAQAVEQSQERLERIRRWQQRIDEEAGEFQGTARRFLDLLETDLPRSEEYLLTALRSLEAARRVQAPGA